MEVNWGGEKGEELKGATDATLKPGGHCWAHKGERNSEVSVGTHFSQEEQRFCEHSCRSWQYYLQQSPVT